MISFILNKIKNYLLRGGESHGENEDRGGPW